MTASETVAPPESPPPPGGRRRGLPMPSFTSMRHREFQLYWVSTALVFFEQGMANVALGWFVLELTDSAAWVSAVVAARGIPMFLLTVPAGVIADRWDRRMMLIITQSLAALGALVFAALVWSGEVTAPIAFVFALVLGSSTAFGLPTRQAIIPMLVPREELLNAIVTGAMARTSSMLIGPMLAGVLITVGGAELSFVVQAVFMVLSTLMLIPMRSASRRVGRASGDADDGQAVRRRSMFGDFREAWRFLRADPALLVIIALMVNTGLFMIGPMQSLVPFLIRDELGGGSGGYGLALSAMALGTLTTSTFLTSMGGMRNKGGFFAMALIGGSICFGSIALSPWLAMAVFFFYVWGAFGGFFQAMSQTLLQTHTPEEMMGRVMGVSTLASMGTMPLGAIIAGVMATVLDAQAAVVISAVICLTFAISALIGAPRFRRLR